MEMTELGAAISKGKARAAKDAGRDVDQLVLAAQGKGLSLRRLAQEAAKALRRKVPASGLSQARRGERPIDPAVAEWIEKRIGFKATGSNWPGGIN
jgi:hypothetical protein